MERFSKILALTLLVSLINFNICLAVNDDEHLKDLTNISNQLQVTIDTMMDRGSSIDYTKDIKAITSLLNYTFQRILADYNSSNKAEDRLRHSELLTVASVYNLAAENLISYNTTKNNDYLQQAIGYKIVGNSIQNDIK